MEHNTLPQCSMLDEADQKRNNERNLGFQQLRLALDQQNIHRVTQGNSWQSTRQQDSRLYWIDSISSDQRRRRYNCNWGIQRVRINTCFHLPDDIFFLSNWKGQSKASTIAQDCCSVLWACLYCFPQPSDDCVQAPQISGSFISATQLFVIFFYFILFYFIGYSSKSQDYSTTLLGLGYPPVSSPRILLTQRWLC